MYDMLRFPVGSPGQPLLGCGEGRVPEIIGLPTRVDIVDVDTRHVKTGMGLGTEPITGTLNIDGSPPMFMMRIRRILPTFR
jgi:hypothetical protein